MMIMMQMMHLHKWFCINIVIFASQVQCIIGI